MRLLSLAPTMMAMGVARPQCAGAGDDQYGDDCYDACSGMISASPLVHECKRWTPARFEGQQSLSGGSVGTKMELTLSASRWISVLDAIAHPLPVQLCGQWSCSVRRHAASMTSRPLSYSCFQTRPGPRLTLRLNRYAVHPVTTDSSRSDWPSSTIIPSMGTRAPGTDEESGRPVCTVDAWNLPRDWIHPPRVARRFPAAIRAVPLLRTRPSQRNVASNQCPRLMIPKRAAASVKYIGWPVSMSDQFDE